MAWIKKNKKRSSTCVSSDKRERSRDYAMTQWRKLRELKRMSDPLCEMCLREGKTTPGDEVHHIRSFTNLEGEERIATLLDYGNLMTVCKRCHQRIHHSHGRKEGDGDGSLI